MSVGVGEEVYILPLASVVESFQVQPDLVKTVGGSGRVVQVRDEFMPVLELERVVSVPRFDFDTARGIMVVVEADGGRVALLVDALLGAGVQPLINLFHWDLPQTLQDRGGFANPQAVGWFTDYAAFGVEYGPHGLDSVVRVPVSSGNTGRAA
jgi:hypothetical protein